MLVDSCWKAFFFDVCCLWLCVFTVMHKCILKAHMKVDWSILEIVSCLATGRDRDTWRKLGHEKCSCEGGNKLCTHNGATNKLMSYKLFGETGLTLMFLLVNGFT